MKNRDVFVRNPDDIVLLNNGVAAMSDLLTPDERRTLRFELEHFICEGEYHRGLERILDSFKTNIGKPHQPAAWISGFFGSGKSHMAKMLHYLWIDYEFPEDGASARGLAVHIPQDIKDSFQELSAEARRGKVGLHAASGTLGAGSGESVRLALLGIIFKSVDLPSNLIQARFCIWLKKNDIYEKIKELVEAEGRDFIRELADLYVSPIIARALIEVNPGFAGDEKEARKTLRDQFAPQKEITIDEFVGAVNDALAPEGVLPYTVVILDEVQQYIGEDRDRSYMVQEVVEACSKKFGSRILFVGTGQTALSGTPALQRLQARFTVNVELSDSDVETVIRKVVLAKKQDARKAVQEVLEANAGEIDRQLVSTKIGPRIEDRKILVDDYPLLPVRRRFWENALRAVDRPGMAAQLRTQLRMVYDAIRATADEPLGTVVPADFLYRDQSENMLRMGVLLREIHETIVKLDDRTEEGTLASRLCGMTFLIGRLPREAAADIGVRATADTLTDLLVSNLAIDGAALRSKVPGILGNLVSKGVLLKIEEEYSLQTREGTEWEHEYQNRRSRIVNDQSRLSHKRAQLLGEAFQEVIKGVKLVQGSSKEPRKLFLHYGQEAPPPDNESISVWVQDGWGADERSVVADSRKAGLESPLITVFIAKEQAEALKDRIAELAAAEETLNFKGVPTTREGTEAMNAMKTRQLEAENNLRALVASLLDGAKVFQGGGREVLERTLKQKVQEAAEASMVRQFPEFGEADDDKWHLVIERAKKGAENPLEVIGHQGKVEAHPVCAKVLTFIGSGKKGRDIRTHFGQSPYGWPRDAVSGALMTLVASGHLEARQNGTPVPAEALDQTKISTADFYVEQSTLTAKQFIELRAMFQKAGFSCNKGEESRIAVEFLNSLIELAGNSGGASPLPPPPDTSHIQDLKAVVGNEQLLAILIAKDTLLSNLSEWDEKKRLIGSLLPEYEKTKSLLEQGEGLDSLDPVSVQLESVEKQRSLLEPSNPIPDLMKEAASILREEINKRVKAYKIEYDKEMKALGGYESWKKLKHDEQEGILEKARLEQPPKIKVGTIEEIRRSLESTPLDAWATMTAALPVRFSEARKMADAMLEPEIQH
ncbi:MAG: BREX system P-loop protein BrxC, partial [Thermovirgaceae bacterium]|nr:BREX system P-loop protein BrxC [Thermovirgaceae bacterium]